MEWVTKLIMVCRYSSYTDPLTGSWPIVLKTSTSWIYSSTNRTRTERNKTPATSKTMLAYGAAERASSKGTGFRVGIFNRDRGNLSVSPDLEHINNCTKSRG